MGVDRCVCTQMTFAELKSHADRTGADAGAMRETYGCGGHCGLCLPYIQAMLETGQTRFPVLSTAEVERLVNNTGL